MHYRITKVHHQAGKQEAMSNHIATMQDKIDEIDGLISVHLIATSDTESYGISVYENEQQIIDAEAQFKEIMAGMMPFMTAPPEISTGGVLWHYTK
jgi:heme-degrading monooxygenase HmoA